MTRADRSFIIANPRNNNARLTQPAECSAASSHYPTDAELTHRFSRGGNKIKWITIRGYATGDWVVERKKLNHNLVRLRGGAQLQYFRTFMKWS